MAEQESLEFGKADFVLLDTVTMPEFMANLRLRMLLFCKGLEADHSKEEKKNIAAFGGG